MRRWFSAGGDQAAARSPSPLHTPARTPGVVRFEETPADEFSTARAPPSGRVAAAASASAARRTAWTTPRTADDTVESLPAPPDRSRRPPASMRDVSELTATSTSTRQPTARVLEVEMRPYLTALDAVSIRDFFHRHRMFERSLAELDRAPLRLRDYLDARLLRSGIRETPECNRAHVHHRDAARPR
jgi:hypothetical protein